MVRYAYRLERRGDKDIILAKNALTKNRSNRYFCPMSQDCTASLHVCDGKNPYFATDRKHPHAGHPAISISSEIYKFKGKNFKFQEAMNKIINLNIKDAPEGKIDRFKENNIKNKGNKVKDKQPHTLRQIYLICKSLPITKMFGNTSVKDMLIDDRSVYHYSETDAVGIHIVETICDYKTFWYDRERKQIHLKLNSKKKNYIFCLNFISSELFGDVENMIWNNTKAIFAVLGNWEACKYREDVCETTINNKRQIWQIR